MPSTMSMEQEEQLVVFRLAGEIYGIPITLVQEIIRYREITRIPRTSEYVRGVLNLRGQIVPVIDLRKRLGLPSAEETNSSRIVVIEMDENVVGMIVDAVTEVLGLPSSRIDPPSDLIADVEYNLIKGVGKKDDRIVILLDVPKTLRLENEGSVRQSRV